MNKVGKWSLCILLLIFAAIFGFVGGSGYFEDLHSAELARTAPYQTIAVVDDAEGWSEEGSRADWWSILFHYTDEQGGYHEGKTNEAYTYSEAYNLVYSQKEMVIKYNDNFEAVAADFKYSHDFGLMTAFFYIGVAAAVGAIAFAVVIIMQTQKENAVKKNGNPALATFVEKTCNTFVNGSPRYRIVYKFNASEEGGAERTVKSKELFTLEDAVYYESNKQFDVKYSGKIAVITEKPYSKQPRAEVKQPELVKDDGACDEHNNCDFDANAGAKVAFDNKDLLSGNDDSNILCEHCAAHLSPKDKHCPNCGAKVSKK